MKNRGAISLDSILFSTEGDWNHKINDTITKTQQLTTIQFFNLKIITIENYLYNG